MAPTYSPRMLVVIIILIALTCLVASDGSHSGHDE